MSLFNVDFAALSSVPKRSRSEASGDTTIHEHAFSSALAIDNLATAEAEASYDYMAECYAFLSDYNRSYFDASKQLYKTIMESCDSPEVIHEGFGDFFGKVKEIIKKFLAWIKKIFNKFIAKMNSMFKSESYLKKNKNEFSKFKTEDEFEFEGYKFTNLYDGGNVPVISTISLGDVNDSLSNAFGNGTLNYDTLKSKYDGYEDSKEDFFDAFRGKVLGDQNDIPASQFDEECFMKFRDDSKEKSKMTITSSEVSAAYMRFEGYDKLKKAVEKTRNDIDKEYGALERYFEKSYKLSKDSFKITDYTGSHSTYVDDQKSHLGMTSGEYNYSDTESGAAGSGNKTKATAAEQKSLIESFLRARAAQVNQMSNIHGIAFSAKLTAAKDCFNQDKAILYKALSKIKGHKADTI